MRTACAWADADTCRIGARGERRNDFQFDRRAGRVGGAHGETVHRGVVERRYRLVGRDRLGEHAANRVVDRQPDGRQAPNCREHVGSRLFERDHGVNLRPRPPTET